MSSSPIAFPSSGRRTAPPLELIAPKPVPNQAQLYAGRYELCQLLGEGGDAEVYFALDHHYNPARNVAVKLLNPNNEATTLRTDYSRLLSEAYAHSRLSSSNIVKLLDIGQADGQYFIVLEYIEGATVEELVNELGGQPTEIISLVGYCVVNALQDIEANNLVHRDIKPGNIMVTTDGDVRLLDFGLAVPLDIAASDSDNENFQCTPQFAAPELIRGGVPNITSDIYALGVTLYYVATGRFPINADTPFEFLRGHLNDTPQPINIFRPDLDERLVTIIHRCLAKHASNRPSSKKLKHVFRGLIESH
jgi:serine/threonine-protein kinase